MRKLRFLGYMYKKKTKDKTKNKRIVIEFKTRIQNIYKQYENAFKNILCKNRFLTSAKSLNR